MALGEREPRVVCPRCRRPRSVCFCAALVPLATKTRVLILQHPRERDVGINTARIARLGLAGAILRSDVDFSDDPVVREVLADGNAYVLFPGKDAIAVETAHFASPITLVVLDGTWWQARKLLKANPALAALPRLCLTPSGPSVYGQIRREPADHCVATLEAVAHVLGHLEGDPSRFAALLAPLDAMVRRQLYFATEVATHRHQRSFVPRLSRDPIPALLRARAPDLVCVHGEANAWPRHHPDRTPPEIVHWLGRRLVGGETFAAVVAPRGRLAPSTCHHIRLPAEALAAGESWESFAEGWRAFLRPRDVLVSWGHFPVATLRDGGIPLAHGHLDARPVAGDVLARRPGTVEECLEAMTIAPPSAWAPGRGGMRLAALCAVVQKLCAWPRP
jgi:DTW domain-containing protein YfiP